eukprot:jgi/Chlat1/8473/Chrsp80S07881
MRNEAATAAAEATAGCLSACCLLLPPQSDGWGYSAEANGATRRGRQQHALSVVCAWRMQEAWRLATKRPGKCKRTCRPQWPKQQQRSHTTKLILCAASKHQRKGHWSDSFIAGAAASLITKLQLQPFDTAKTLLQASTSPDLRALPALCTCLSDVVKKQGFLGLYSGLVGSVATSAPASAVFFTSYEFFKSSLKNAPSAFAPFSPAIAAALGNVVASGVRVPPELLKQRVQMGHHTNMLQAMYVTAQREGLKGFYRGYTAQLVRDVPYAMLQFAVFEALKRSRSEESQQSTGHLLTGLWRGAVAGGVASALTTPLDVVKTRLMTQPTPLPGMPVAYRGMRHTAARIWTEEGALAFTRGIAPRLLYKIPASAIFLMSYEAIRRLLVVITVDREERRKEAESEWKKRRSTHTYGRTEGGQVPPHLGNEHPPRTTHA